MKVFRNRRGCYGLLWIGLVLAVAMAWIFGRSAPEVKGEPAAQGPVSQSPEPKVESAALPSPLPEEEKKQLVGLWVPYMALETEGHTRRDFEENFREIVNSAEKIGVNALFVHLRPFSDALYPSELFPWSHLLTGEQGKDPGWDPTEFMVEYTHHKGMEFHAWLNPLRVKTAETPEDLSADNLYVALGEENPYYFMEWEGGVYLDPAYPYVRTLIAKGAAEIAERYEVEGIHFDDYFYPAQDESLDQEAYDLYLQVTETPLSREEWRMANISALVEEVYQAVKAARPQAQFGISPQGNLENNKKLGADVKAWCAVPGYVDYLCPQLYFSFENPSLGFSEAFKEWSALPRHKELRLYAGLALYKAGSDADEGTWKLSSDILLRQIRQAKEAGWDGTALYSSQYIDVQQTQEEVKNAMAALSD